MVNHVRWAGRRDLGVDSRGFGAEAVLDERGTVVVRQTEFEGEAPDSITLEREQAKTLVAWLVNREELAEPG